mmetsp:Transcript_8276/g.18073  ORF Transcript_8276/g.18073 Transcript_8276/m.18073 type:complete len:249 (-) Transcript_8276:837-1583(-)
MAQQPSGALRIEAPGLALHSSAPAERLRLRVRPAGRALPFPGLQRAGAADADLVRCIPAAVRAQTSHRLAQRHPPNTGLPEGALYVDLLRDRYRGLPCSGSRSAESPANHLARGVSVCSEHADLRLRPPVRGQVLGENARNTFAGTSLANICVVWLELLLPAGGAVIRPCHPQLGTESVLPIGGFGRRKCPLVRHCWATGGDQTHERGYLCNLEKVRTAEGGLLPERPHARCHHRAGCHRPLFALSSN